MPEISGPVIATVACLIFVPMLYYFLQKASEFSGK
jgi:hypothetical protein